MYGAPGISDETVVAACDGSKTDQTRLVAALEPQVRAAIVARLSPAPVELQAVDDIFQEVMAALLANLATLERRTALGLRSFLSRITANKVVDFVRTRRRLPAGRPVKSLDSTVGQFSDAGPLWQFLSNTGTTPSQPARQAELIQHVRCELAKLKPEHREVIILAIFSQLPTSEVAELMETSRPAASMLLIRALSTLRKNIGKSAQSEGVAARAS